MFDSVNDFRVQLYEIVKEINSYNYEFLDDLKELESNYIDTDSIMDEISEFICSNKNENELDEFIEYCDEYRWRGKNNIIDLGEYLSDIKEAISNCDILEMKEKSDYVLSYLIENTKFPQKYVSSEELMKLIKEGTNVGNRVYINREDEDVTVKGITPL